jgi:hypothetical protein
MREFTQRGYGIAARAGSHCWLSPASHRKVPAEMGTPRMKYLYPPCPIL